MKLGLISLGCDKNLVDSEKLLAILAGKGHEFTDDMSEAQALIFNTCCFVGDAKQESIDSILAAAEYKQDGVLKWIIVTGCLAERYREEIIREIPEVDHVLGVMAMENISVLLEALENGDPGAARDVCCFPPQEGMIFHTDERWLTTSGHYAYLKIAEGCDKHCTYCIIPRVKGGYRSEPMENIISEAGKLAENGVKELIIIAQETTIYGMDLYGCKMLPELLERLSGIEGIRWIRIMYAYPEEITPELIQVMAGNKKILHYLDMPIQHCSDRILKKMGRKTSKSDIKGIVSGLREAMPDIIIRTTLIAGFPGETPEEHEEMLEFVDEIEFDRLGCFTYSQEEGTPAAELSCQLEESLKDKYRDEIMELQQEIIFEKNEDHIGKELNIIVEGRVLDDDADMMAGEEDDEEGFLYAGRSYMDCPEVDGYVFFRSSDELMTGCFVNVRITGTHGYDMVGVMEAEI